MAFKDWLLEFRTKAGLTQARLQEAIGKKEGYIAKIETGKFIPPREVCHAIADALRKAGLEVTHDQVWSVAAPEVADPWVRRHYENLLEGQRGRYERRLEEGQNLTETEALLLRLIRMHQQEADTELMAKLAEYPEKDHESVRKAFALDIAQALEDILMGLAAAAQLADEPSAGPYIRHVLRQVRERSLLDRARPMAMLQLWLDQLAQERQHGRWEGLAEAKQAMK